MVIKEDWVVLDIVFSQLKKKGKRIPEHNNQQRYVQRQMRRIPSCHNVQILYKDSTIFAVRR